MVSDKHVYRKCLQCGYFFRIKAYIVDYAYKAKSPIKCPSCGASASMIRTCLKVEWAKNKGLMDKALWNENFERGLK